jgi:AcrR family transcriptional regulator
VDGDVVTENVRQLAARPPGRPRSERAEKAIIEATLDLLAEEGGAAGVTIEAVAARAGVGKTTIYRRWQGKEALIIDALATLKGPIPELAGRSVRDDLLTMARALSQVKRENRRLDFFYWNLLGGGRHPELARRFEQDVIEPRREVFRAVLRRGIATGELRADIDVDAAYFMIVGAITARARARTPGPLPADFADRVVDSVLGGLSAT